MDSEMYEMKVMKNYETHNIDIIAFSADSETDTREGMIRFKLTFPVGFGFTTVQMRQLIIFMSSPVRYATQDYNFA